MNSGRLTGLFRSVLLAGLSLILLTSTSGLSFKAHYCNGNLHGIAFYTELGLQQSITCGCDHTGSAAGYPDAAGNPALKKKSCCSNISYYSKLEVVSKANHYLPEFLFHTPVVDAIQASSLPVVSDETVVCIADDGFRPPPRAGRDLVLFLSQQRIPFGIYS